VLALAVLAAVVVLANVASRNHGAAGADLPSRPSSTRSADTRVSVRRSDYLGMPSEEAKARLESKGLHVQEGTWANSQGRRPDTVANVSPVGMLERGSTVTLQVWGRPQPTAHPKPKPDKHGWKQKWEDWKRHHKAHGLKLPKVDKKGEQHWP
jgi:hypothetical protein